MACDADECCVGEEMRCSGAAVLVFIVLLVCVGLYHAYSRRRVIKQVKDEEVRQRVARDLFANQLAASFGSLTMDDATIRAAHKSLGEISPEIKSLFATIDYDGSGALSRAEVAQLLTDQGIAVDQKYLDGVLDAYDLDQSGEIELEEFAALYTVLRRKATDPPPTAAPLPSPAAVPTPFQPSHAMQGGATAPARGTGPTQTARGRVQPPPLALLGASRGMTPPRGRPPPLP